MRAWGVVGVALLAAACSYKNPAFGSGNETGAVTSGSDSSGVATAGSGESTEAEPPEGRCDLYAINAEGQLRIIDVDTGSSRVMLDEPVLGSESIATNRMTGSIYLSPTQPSRDLFTIDPAAPEDYGRSIVQLDMLGSTGRATFHQGNLWLGTYQGSRFIEVRDGGVVIDDDTYASGEGGDMVFIDQDHALIVSLLGAAKVYDFNIGVENSVLFSNARVGLSGLAYDLQGRLWASTSAANSQLHRVEVVDNGDDTFDVTAGPLIDLNASYRISDLATVVTPTDDC